MQENRQAMIRVSEDQILNMFARKSEFQWRDIIWFHGVPVDAKIERVFHDPMEQMFCFILSHETFPVRPQGTKPFVLEAKVCAMRVAISTTATQP